MTKFSIVIIALILVSATVFGQKQKNVKYKVAKNYFINNTYQNGDIINYKIVTAEDFSKFIGMATVMGNDGKPTEINFNKQFVILAVNDLTDIETELVPEKLFVSSKGELTFNFETKIGNKTTYTMRPFTMIIVDKKYKNYKIILETYSVL